MSCFVCKAPITSDRVSICGKDVCKIKIELIDDGDIISNKILRDIECSRLLLDLAVEAVKSARWQQVFLPMPVFFNKSSQTDLIEYALSIQTGWDQIILNLIESHHGRKDRELHTLLRDDQYVFLKFTMMTFGKLESCPELSIDPAKSNTLKLPELNVYKVLNTRKEKNFKKRVDFQAQYLYHGSRCENWYSIMRNGLKNMSGTLWQVNGARYGSGIYCAASTATSVPYTNIPYRIMAVLETSKDPNVWQREPGVYVIPNGDDVIIRYILVMRSTDSDINDITMAFNHCQNLIQIIQNQSKNR